MKPLTEEALEKGTRTAIEDSLAPFLIDDQIFLICIPT